MKKQCVNCQHLNGLDLSRCEKCNYFLISVEMVEAVAPRKSNDAPSSAKTDATDQEYLNLAFQQLLLLVERAKREQNHMSDADRASVYEGLLTSFLKMEREKIRRNVLLYEKDNVQVTHKRLLIALWGLGMLSGVLLMTALVLIFKG
jgi:hypothetical protein